MPSSHDEDDDTDAVGTQTRSCLSDFEQLSRLGSGSFGTVYKVKRKLDGATYVLKNVRIVELSYKEQSDAINEVTILSQLDSLYVVRYYDSFLDGDSLYIVMEYCNRGDLQNLIKKAIEKDMDCLRDHVVWNISLQVILGLYYLHSKKVLHRDLKSANVFLMKSNSTAIDGSPYFQVKIGDLGVAKLLETSTAFAQTIVGTPYYLSPELCSDKPYRDKSDCWALGVLLYECCTLKHPFEARNQCALVMKIIQAQVKPPNPSTTPSDLSRLIMWLLQKDPARRPTIRHLLCEDVIRNKIIEHNFELPDDLFDATTTQYLSISDDDDRGNASNASIAIHNNHYYNRNDDTITFDESYLNKHGNTYSNTSNTTITNSIHDGSNTYADNMMKTKIVHYTDNSNHNDRRQQPLLPPQQQQRSKSMVPPSAGAIRGTRVRGPATAKRNISGTALMVHQVKTSSTLNSFPSSSTGTYIDARKVNGKVNHTVSNTADEKIQCHEVDTMVKYACDSDEEDQDDDDDIEAPPKYSNSDSKMSFTIKLSEPYAVEGAATGLDVFESDSKHEAYTHSHNNSASIPRLNSTIDNQDKGSGDSKHGNDANDVDDYYEDDFEDYDGGNTDAGRSTLRKVRSNYGNGDMVGEDYINESLRSIVDNASYDLWEEDTLFSTGDSIGHVARVDSGVDDIYGDDNNTEISVDEQCRSLGELIVEAKLKSIDSLGEELFDRVYDLCKKHMMIQQMVHDTIETPSDSYGTDDAYTTSFLEELERLLYTRNTDSDVHNTERKSAVNAVFSVKVLLALEFKIDKLKESKDYKK